MSLLQSFQGIMLCTTVVEMLHNFLFIFACLAKLSKATKKKKKKGDA